MNTDLLIPAHDRNTYSAAKYEQALGAARDLLHAVLDDGCMCEHDWTNEVDFDRFCNLSPEVSEIFYEISNKEDAEAFAKAHSFDVNDILVESGYLNPHAHPNFHLGWDVNQAILALEGTPYAYEGIEVDEPTRELVGKPVEVFGSDSTTLRDYRRNAFTANVLYYLHRVLHLHVSEDRDEMTHPDTRILSALLMGTSEQYGSHI